MSKSLAKSVSCQLAAGLWANVVATCQGEGRGYRAAPMVEPGLVTLAKIVGTLLLAMGVIPFIFLLSPGGDKNEPKDNFDDLV